MVQDRIAKSPVVMVCYIFRLVKRLKNYAGNHHQIDHSRICISDNISSLFSSVTGRCYMMYIYIILSCFALLHTRSAIASFDIFHSVFRFCKTLESNYILCVYRIFSLITKFSIRFIVVHFD